MKTNRTIVVTGAAGGLGTPIVDRFLANGDVVIAVGREEKEMLEFHKEHDQQKRLSVVAADVNVTADCERVANAARARSNKVDVLVNLAGSFPTQTFDDLTADEFRRILDSNLTSAFNMVKAVYPLMKDGGWGRIINTSSAAIYEGVAMQIPYVAAKAGLIGFTRSLAQAFGEHGITVNTIAPGLTLSPPVRKNFPKDLLSQQVQLRALKREENPEDLTGTVFFLASPDADLITGQTIVVDGGRQML